MHRVIACGYMMETDQTALVGGLNKAHRKHDPAFPKTRGFLFGGSAWSKEATPLPVRADGEAQEWALAHGAAVILGDIHGVPIKAGVECEASVVEFLVGGQIRAVLKDAEDQKFTAILSQDPKGGKTFKPLLQFPASKNTPKVKCVPFIWLEGAPMPSTEVQEAMDKLIAMASRMDEEHM